MNNDVLLCKYMHITTQKTAEKAQRTWTLYAKIYFDHNYSRK